MKQNISVIIVGSGISGFTAAVKLIENGFSDVTILEAEDRIGGRIFTTEFGDGLIDLGETIGKKNNFKLAKLQFQELNGVMESMGTLSTNFLEVRLLPRQEWIFPK